jgi:hypothetical protein
VGDGLGGVVGAAGRLTAGRGSHEGQQSTHRAQYAAQGSNSRSWARVVTIVDGTGTQHSLAVCGGLRCVVFELCRSSV